jgi:hypothetical protein
LSAKRTRDESIEQKIVEILQELENLSGQALLKKILEDKSYNLFDDNKHVYCQSCQKPITLHRFNDGIRLKEHIITPTHIENSQKTTQRVESKRMRSTFLTSFFNKTNDKYNMPTDTDIIDLTEPAEDQSSDILLINQNQKPAPLKITSENSEQCNTVC